MTLHKVVIFAAGRPDFARLARIIERLDADPEIECIFVNSGQHSHTDVLDRGFIENLGLRQPDYNLDIGAWNADWHAQIAMIFERLTPLLEELKPDAFINLGDMNPCFSGVVAKRLRIPYIRIECGMRSGTIDTAYKNWDLPEEINRVAMDSIADLKLVYSHDYVPHLIREGHHPDTIKVVGNTIIDALDYYTQKWGIVAHHGDYDVATFHRGNNMTFENLAYFAYLINDIACDYERHIKFVCYGRTKKEMEHWDLFDFHHNVEVIDSQTQEDFLRLIAGCNVILSDSGSTSSEESHYFHKPALILRDSTERPTTLIKNNLQDGNAYLWDMDIEKDMAKYHHLCGMTRDWNNRYYAAPNGRSSTENIYDAIVEFLDE